MTEPQYPNQALYERGIAVGHADIKTDAVIFQYWDEEISIPTSRLYGIAKYNGYFYEADIDDVRRMEAAGAA